MGKTKQAGVTLADADYLDLLVARGAIETAFHEGQAAVKAAADSADASVKATQVDFTAVLARLGKKYRFDVTASYRFDDKHRRLIPEGKTPT